MPGLTIPVDVTLNTKSVVTVPNAPPVKVAAAIVIVSPGMYSVPPISQDTVVIVNCVPVVVIVNCAPVPPWLPFPVIPDNEPLRVPTVVDIICCFDKGIGPDIDPIIVGEPAIHYLKYLLAPYFDNLFDYHILYLVELRKLVPLHFHIFLLFLLL